MESLAIRNRRDLSRHLQAQMTPAGMGWSVEDDEIEKRTSVKTYLLEAHCDYRTPEGARDLLSRLSPQLGLAVSETDDPQLISLRSPKADLWADISLGRFWRVHTTAPVEDSDTLRDRLVRSSPWIDNVWLPPRMLENLPARTGALMQTFSLNHDRRLLHPRESEAAEFDFVTLRLWASRAAEKLAKLRNTDLFPHGVSTRSVRLRSDVEAKEGDDSEFCIAEYFHHGKVTASGTSFDEHTRILVNVLRDYRSLVEHIEKTFGIGHEHGKTHPALCGDPITIAVEWTVTDIAYAIQRMFSCAEPFRLWGLPELVAANQYRARAVDLHVGGTLTFDISPDQIVIQLPKGACGNSIVRFIGSLQYHVNADVGEAFLRDLSPVATQ